MVQVNDELSLSVALSVPTSVPLLALSAIVFAESAMSLGDCGTGGVPAYLPPGGLSDTPYARLKGRPVIPVEYCATLGTVGDIILADLSEYRLIDAAMQNASSMHVAFTTNEMAFRVTYECDGQSRWKSALTPFKGSNTLSPFVALATRA